MPKSILFAIVAILFAACSRAVEITPIPIPPSATAEPEPTATTIPTSTPIPSPTLVPTATPIPHDRYTGIVMGGDFDVRRPERNRFGVRSDVFLIYVFDFYPTLPDQNQVSLISLPRDLWLEVPCSPLDPALESNDRINAAWAYGQFDCAKDAVEANFNLEINALMLFTDFDGFMWVVGRLGAVKLTPTTTYSDWCGNYHGTAGDIGSGYFTTWYEGQEYNFGPNEALCYVRARTNSNDLGRNRRSLEMIEALGDQYMDFLFDTMDPDNIIIPEASRAQRRYIRMGLDETDFYVTPIYGASVLLPTVDLAEWLDCMIDRDLPIEIVDGQLLCTQMNALEEVITIDNNP